VLASVLAAVAIPQFAVGLADARTRAGARHLAGRMQAARAQAVAQGTSFGVRVTVRGHAVFIQTYRDGNQNGLRAVDVGAGIDVPVDREVGVADLFSHVHAGAADGSIPPPVAEATFWYSFAPTGTASSGTVYLRGAGLKQYAVRVLGATGRVRVLRFREASSEWLEEP